MMKHKSHQFRSVAAADDRVSPQLPLQTKYTRTHRKILQLITAKSSAIAVIADLTAFDIGYIYTLLSGQPWSS